MRTVLSFGFRVSAHIIQAHVRAIIICCQMDPCTLAWSARERLCRIRRRRPPQHLQFDKHTAVSGMRSRPTPSLEAHAIERCLSVLGRKSHAHKCLGYAKHIIQVRTHLDKHAGASKYPCLEKFNHLAS